MGGGGLFDPLGTDRAPAARPMLNLSTPVVVAALTVAALAALLAVAWLRDDGGRGTPRAVSTIEHVTPPKAPAPPAPATPVQTSTPPPPAAAAAPDDQEVEIQNGVRIIRPHRAPAASGGITIAVPGTPPVQR